MSRRGRFAPVPATMVGPLLLAVAMLAVAGLPMPHLVSVYGPREDLPGWAQLDLDSGAEVRAWAEHFGAPTEVYTEETYVRTRVRRVELAGIKVELAAADYVDDQADIDARDRAADVRDLAAAVAAGELTGCPR